MAESPLTLEAAPEIAAIREALEAFPKGWECAFKAKTEDEFGIVEIGHRWEDDQGLAEVITVDTANHYDSPAAAKIADYLMACNPAAMTAVLATIAQLEARLREAEADAGPVTAVLAVDVGGRPGVHGQTIGADGAGQFAYIIRGTQEQADNWAREHIDQREKAGQQLFSCTLVFNEEGYGGPMLTSIDAAIAAHGKDST